MLGLVIFAIILGLTLGNMGESGKPVLNFFKSLGDASMLITSKLVMYVYDKTITHFNTIILINCNSCNTCEHQRDQSVLNFFLQNLTSRYLLLNSWFASSPR